MRDASGKLELCREDGCGHPARYHVEPAEQVFTYDPETDDFGEEAVCIYPLDQRENGYLCAEHYREFFGGAEVAQEESKAERPERGER